jgi:hypothetical protein
MAVQDRVTPEEWRALCAGPWAVGGYVATAFGGKVQEVRELLALGGALRLALERDHERDPVGAVAAAALGEGITAASLGLPPDDRAALLRAVAAAGAAARALPDGAAYLRWLMELARHVAAAEADGGFMGLGAEQFHVAEQIALAELAEALGLLEEPW